MLRGFSTTPVTRGGFSTKLYLTTATLGNTLRFILTRGERNDIPQAEAPIAAFRAE